MADMIHARFARVLRAKEGLSAMSATQLDKVFTSLHKLEKGMVGVCDHITTSRGEVLMERKQAQRSLLVIYNEEATVLNCKKGILSAQTSFDRMKEGIASLSDSNAVERAERLAGLSELALKEAEDGSKELEVSNHTPFVRMCQRSCTR